VTTGTRAEFGLLETVMRAIDAHPKLQLRTVVTGTHLLPPTNTWRHVQAAGFPIDAKVKMQRAGETGRAADVAALGKGIAGLGRAFDKLQPDVVLLLGDRIEAFAAASAASVGGTRVAHLHGGDRAEGVADEAMRHAITKLAHLHFPATAQSKRRILRLGEDERFVWNVGAPAIDGLHDLVAESVHNPLVFENPDYPHHHSDTPPPRYGIIVLQHPIGADDAQEEQWMVATLNAVKRVARQGEAVLLLSPNHDPGRDGIDRAMKFAALPGSILCGGLFRWDFVAALATARVLVGNSSAGLIEAAALKTPVVNVGPRQNGRQSPANVVDCDHGQTNVTRAIRAALRLDLTRMRHPYGKGDTGQRVADTLASLDLQAVPLRKHNAY